MTLLVRLGLRAGEVAALQLDDIDWRAGAVVIHGKGGRQDQLPLPSEVGEAIAFYLRRGRPVSACRAVFLARLRAGRPDDRPLRGRGLPQRLTPGRAASW